MTRQSIKKTSLDQLASSNLGNFNFSDPRFEKLSSWTKLLTFLYEAEAAIKLAKKYNTEPSLSAQEQVLLSQSLLRNSIVTYSKCYASSGSFMVSLDANVVFANKPELRIIHDKILEARNRFVAHNDSNEFETVNTGVMEVLDRFFVVLTYTLQTPVSDFNEYTSVYDYVGEYVMRKMIKILHKIGEDNGKLIEMYDG
jgi:hypothetical protein